MSSISENTAINVLGTYSIEITPSFDSNHQICFNNEKDSISFYYYTKSKSAYLVNFSLETYDYENEEVEKILCKLLNLR